MVGAVEPKKNKKPETTSENGANAESNASNSAAVPAFLRMCSMRCLKEGNREVRRDMEEPRRQIRHTQRRPNLIRAE